MTPAIVLKANAPNLSHERAPVTVRCTTPYCNSLRKMTIH
jgi:hypothetical protein